MCGVRKQNWMFLLSVEWICEPNNAKAASTMTLYWIQYFIYFIAMDTYICILCNPLTTFHQLAIVSFFYFRSPKLYALCCWYFCLQFGQRQKWISFFLAWVYLFVWWWWWRWWYYTHTHKHNIYLPICSIDTSREKEDRENEEDTQRITKRK